MTRRKRDPVHDDIELVTAKRLLGRGGVPNIAVQNGRPVWYGAAGLAPVQQVKVYASFDCK